MNKLKNLWTVFDNFFEGIDKELLELCYWTLILALCAMSIIFFLATVAYLFGNWACLGISCAMMLIVIFYLRRKLRKDCHHGAPAAPALGAPD